MTSIVRMRVGSRSSQLEGWEGTASTGPGSLGRGQRLCLAAALPASVGTTGPRLGLVRAGLANSILNGTKTPSVTNFTQMPQLPKVFFKRNMSVRPFWPPKRNIWFLFGIRAPIRIGQESWCLPYSGFLIGVIRLLEKLHKIDNVRKYTLQSIFDKF